MNGTLSTEVDAYLAVVRAALADLPPAAREELLEDLAEHLNEVAAEGDGSLVERLGPAQEYAAELRAAAGLPRGSRWAAMDPAAVADLVGRWGRGADERAGRVLGYGRASEFGRLLRPAWWVLRGYVVAVVLLNALLPNATGLLPPASESFWFWLVAIVACVLGSIRLGVSARAWVRRPVDLALLLAANAALAVTFVGGAFAYADRTMFTEPTAAYENPYSGVNVFPYDEQGRPLTGVRLLDQYGNPVNLGGGAVACAYRDGQDQNVYPRCNEPHPYASLPPVAGATPSPTAPPASPTVSATPPPTVSPTG